MEGILTVIIFEFVMKYASKEIEVLGGVRNEEKNNKSFISLFAFSSWFLYLVGSSKNGEFGGADDQIEDTIAEVNEEYEPWFESLGNLHLEK